MMIQTSYYQKYARIAFEQSRKKDLASPYLLVGTIKDPEVQRVLDIGCGTGQTKKNLDREFSKHNLKIEGILPANKKQSPSYPVVKK